MRSKPESPLRSPRTEVFTKLRIEGKVTPFDPATAAAIAREINDEMVDVRRAQKKKGCSIT